VYVADDASLSPYMNETWLPVVQQIVQQANPALIVFGQTSIGRDLAPRLAFRLDTGVSMDTIEVSYDGSFHMQRSAYGGNARAIVSPVKLPAVATVKAKSQEPIEQQAGKQAEVVNVSLAPVQARTKVLGQQKAKAAGIRLEDAEIVVSGGRGLGSPEGFKPLEELADVLGGATGASRAACDLGWYPPSKQVGLTGTTVSPNVYIAVAISGASQHMAGMSGSKNIIAINKDPDANMVKVSRFAVIGDYKQVVPPLIEEVRKLKS
ncbi:MAG TPA: electron transfer flavoprotein subunit alpha/FixB family protein, partial [Dehalococcoidia bacterium]|nr:electron transfer flavoprotein subunit alpha/FixB family protein [Dehalococcoidia bacterium]